MSTGVADSLRYAIHEDIVSTVAIPDLRIILFLVFSTTNRYTYIKSIAIRIPSVNLT